jgi:PTH1 family peptidyl-tRNA hydrolase
MQLWVGLGNPGRDYARNRHNIGFMALDAIHGRYGFPAWRAKFQGLYSEGSIAGVRVHLLKPQTYMNESGRSVAEAVRFFKIPRAEISEAVTVFHDELDLAPGKIRVKTGGGLAGHNGLRSINAHLGPDFRRVRIGIGHPGDKDMVLGHVLNDFSKADQKWVEATTDAIAQAADTLAPGDGNEFMSKVALILQPPRPKKPAPDAPENAAGPEAERKE